MVGRAGAAGSPRFGVEAAIWICGGATTVGSAVSFGCSLRTHDLRRCDLLLGRARELRLAALGSCRDLHPRRRLPPA